MGWSPFVSTQAQEIEDIMKVRKEKERLAHLNFLQERAQKKAAGNARRLAMREDSLAREREEVRRAAAAVGRKQAELEKEAKERRNMSIEEARQTAIDDFWGLPTRWAHFRRIEIFKLKVWNARVADRNKRAVQVELTNAATEEETERIRFEKEP